MLNKYEKRISINENALSKDLLILCTLKLYDCMFETCKCPEFIQLNLTDSDIPCGKDLVLYWADSTIGE